jgi:colanic acid biosynthesis protein WcaH
MTDMLGDTEFAQVIQRTPLVAVDLIIRDPDRRILVGLRANEPAKGFYFIPGGRIRKNEKIKTAFARILKSETGCLVAFENARFVGVFEHFYPNNRFGAPGYGTHVIVLAYEVSFDRRPEIVLDSQHSAFRWMHETELKVATDVHDYTKAYFKGKS